MLDESKVNEILREAKDSKLLMKGKREELYKEYIKKVKYKVIKVKPFEVDYAVKSKIVNLNLLEAQKFAIIINALKPDKAILDCPSRNIVGYTNYLRVFLKDKKVELVAKHSADRRYKIVAAASIIAKVVRDREIEKIKKKYGNVGSGYPADPVTKRFLEKNWKKYPEIFRRSWMSWRRIEDREKQRNLGDFSE